MSAGRSGYLQEMQRVPGWLDPLDASLICALSDHQHAAGMLGDILEIGVFHGRSAILLGYLLSDGEQLIACDTFGSDTGLAEENARWNGRFYPGLDRREFERNYLRYHKRLPTVAAVPSAGLGSVARRRSCRLVHVDGAHDYPTVCADARVSRELCADDGVVIFDDYCKAHLPGTALAVWEQVICAGLVPVALTDAKLYGCWPPAEASVTRAALTSWALGSEGVRVDEHRLGPHTVPRIIPRPAAWPAAQPAGQTQRIF